MAEYRIYTVDAKGRVTHAPIELVCDTDEEAIAVARGRLKDRTLEIFEGARRVATMTAGSPNEAP